MRGAGGLIALATLLILEATLDRLRAHPRFQRRSQGVNAAVVMVGPQVDHRELQRSGVRPAELWAALRRAGVRNVADVGAVVLEADGALTVLPSGRRVDRRILVGVRGAEHLPPEMLDVEG